MPVGVQPTGYRIEVLQLLVELCRYLRTHVGSGRWLRQVLQENSPEFGAPERRMTRPDHARITRHRHPHKCTEQRSHRFSLD